MKVESLFSGLSISASGLRAQRLKQSAISSNLANIETTRTPEGGAYKRQFVVFEADKSSKEMQLLDKKEGLNGLSTDPNHLPIPANNYPADERFMGTGVKVTEIRQDSRPPKMVYNPSHPDADEKGYVALPNINVVEEMTDMIAATRAYEANVTAFNATKSMISQAIQM